MFGDQAKITGTFDLSVDPGGDKNYPIFKAPIALTVESFSAVVLKTQNAGTAVALRLINMGTPGTASAGTISAILGGTASAARLTASVPATSTTMTTPYVAANEWIGLQVDEEGAGWESGDVVRVQFVATPGVQS